MAFGIPRARVAAIRAIALGCVLALVGLAVSTQPAEARRKRGGGYAPPYAAMVVDVKSGRTLHAVNEDALRHPASITKVMTLYLMFEQLERGRFTMDSQLKVSSEAASQAPSKLGLDPGDTISVHDAILALITKSANDVAVTIAENLAGSEDAFAVQMTQKAHALGMRRTVYRNASGLPDPEQVTTARDLTILARAIQERFPKYYPLFSTRNFNYAGDNLRNHNKLLGRVEGVDGIKTGYTRASGFNLMTSARSDGRHIVAVVLGGRSGSVRDRIMADLVVASLPRARTGERTAPMVAEAPAARPRPAVVAEAVQPRIEPKRERPAEPVTAEAPLPPTRVATRPAPLDLSATRPVVASTATPPAMRWAAGAAPLNGQVVRPRGEGALRPPANVDSTSSIARVAEPEERREEALAFARAEPAPRPLAKAAPAPVAATPAATSAVAKAEPRPEPKAAETKHVRSAWVIQLGATDDEGKARDILSRARTKGGTALSDAAGFTEKVEKGGATLFRARFAGFDDAKDAENACRTLKRGGFACFATRG